MDAHRTKAIAGRILLGCILGFITTWLVGMIKYLPYSSFRDRVRDGLSFPGGLLAYLVYPGGVHSDQGAGYWAELAYWANVVFYVLVWFLALHLLHRRRIRTESS